MSGGTALFPPPGVREGWDDALTRLLLQAEGRVQRGSVRPTLDHGALRQDLAGFDFETPLPIGGLLDWTIAQMEHGIVQMTHPRYCGLFNPAPTFPAQCADRIAAAFNPQLATATTSPAAIEIEAHVIRALARRAGLPDGSAGHFTSGGTEANGTALTCALTHAEPGFATDGARAFRGPARFYTSRDCHLAWVKIAHQAGIGRAAVRLVPTDGTGRMDVAALAGMIESDRAHGCTPVMVVATAGTTNAGMVDPLAAVAAAARQAGAWYHVDAAWGGAALASQRLRGLLAGMELADSITIDAHKWFATTMGCGMFITSRAAVLSDAFHVSTSFMPSNAPSLDPYVTSAQWSRRFVGLRLFLSLAAAGWDGYADHVEHAVALTSLLRDRLAALGWRALNDSSMAVACLVPPPGAGSPKAVAAKVVASGQAWVSAAVFEGQDVVRACVTHGGTTADDIGALVDALQAAALVR